MQALFFVLAIAGVIWGLYIARNIGIVVQLLGVMIAGAIIGHSFYNLTIGPIPITIDRVLLGLVGANFLIQALVKREAPFQLDRIDLLVLALFVFLTVNTFMYDWRFRDNTPIGRLLFFNWIPIAFYFIARNSTLKPIDFKLLFAGLTLFGLYLSLTSIAEVKGPHSVIFPSYITSPEYTEFLGRARGPFLNPVSCGVYQIVCLCGAMMFWPHLGRIGKSVLILMAPIFVAGVFFTLTRSVWLTAAWGVLLVCWLPSDLRIRSMIATAAVMGLFLGLLVYGDRIQSFKRDKNVSEYEMSQSANLRPLLATVAFRMFEDRPVFGCGFGQYSKYKKPYHYEDADGAPLRAVLPYMQHNVFLSYLTESGLVGLGLLLSVLVGFTARAWRTWKMVDSTLWFRQVGLLGLVVVSSYVINGIFHDVSIIDMMGTLLFFFGGMVVNLSDQRNQHSSPADESIPFDDHENDIGLSNQAA